MNKQDRLLVGEKHHPMLDSDVHPLHLMALSKQSTKRKERQDQHQLKYNYHWIYSLLSNPMMANWMMWNNQSDCSWTEYEDQLIILMNDRLLEKKKPDGNCRFDWPWLTIRIIS